MKESSAMASHVEVDTIEYQFREMQHFDSVLARLSKVIMANMSQDLKKEEAMGYNHTQVSFLQTNSSVSSV